MNKIKELFAKYKEIITYVVFGALTTLVNFVVFWGANKIFGDKYYLINNALAWIISVIFAYVTNKLWVFGSKSWAIKIVAKEALEFVAARLFSFVVEEGGLLLFVDVLGFSKYSFTVLGFKITGQLVAKVILAVIVVILNYFFSKFVIFRKEKSKKENNEK
ncbi:MAG: GtrA family protein [Clostridiales bacterium]|nr:GtrA family protein [Clostridiales bacterium]